MERAYWLYIESYVYFVIKRGRIIFYNSLNGKILEFSDNSLVLGLARRLKHPSNLQVIRITESEYRRPPIREFIDKLRDYFIGDIIDVTDSQGKPIVFKPILKIQKDISILKSDYLRTPGEDILTDLSEISIYINNQCDQDCSICRNGFLQFLCCTTFNAIQQELGLNWLNNLFSQIENQNDVEIHILGGNIFLYSHLKRLLSLLKDHRKKYFHVHFLNAVEQIDKLSNLLKYGGRLIIIVDFNLDLQRIENSIKKIHNSGIPYSYQFIISSLGEYEMAYNLSLKFPVENVDYKPFFNETNYDFFSENLFLNKEDIEREKPSPREISSRGVINPLNFGKLIVKPDGRVFANMHEAALGKLGEKDTVWDMILKEMKTGKSWRRIRKYVLPCKSCPFEKLCPPISNLNRMMRKYNLCHIYPSKVISSKNQIKRKEIEE